MGGITPVLATLGHPFLENNEFRERMSQVASTAPDIWKALSV